MSVSHSIRWNFARHLTNFDCVLGRVRVVSDNLEIDQASSSKTTAHRTLYMLRVTRNRDDAEVVGYRTD